MVLSGYGWFLVVVGDNRWLWGGNSWFWMVLSGNGWFWVVRLRGGYGLATVGFGW